MSSRQCRGAADSSPSAWVPGAKSTVPPTRPMARVATPMRTAMTMGITGSEALEDDGVGHAATLADRLQAPAGTGPMHLVNQRGHHPRSGAPERMPERDRAAVDVGLVPIGAGLGEPGADDGGERLVDLEEVDVVDAKAGPGA